MKKQVSFTFILVTSLLCGLLLTLFFGKGEPINEKGQVIFDGWEVTPYDKTTCFAGTNFENGEVWFAILDDTNNSENYLISIQSAKWDFPPSVLEKEFPVDVSVIHHFDRIQTTGKATSPHRIQISIPRDRVILLQIKNHQEVKFNFSGYFIIFELLSLNKVFNELERCQGRITDYFPTSSNKE